MMVAMNAGLSTTARSSTTSAGAGEPGSELRIDSDAVRVVRTDHRIAIAFVLFLFVFGGLMGWPATPGVVLLFAAVYAIWRGFSARVSGGVVCVKLGAGGGLVVERSGKRAIIERSKVVNCWKFPRDQHIDVVVATQRSLISICLSDRAIADALGRAVIDTRFQLAGTALTEGVPATTAPRRQHFAYRHPRVVGLGILVLLFLELMGTLTVFSPFFVAAFFVTLFIVLTRALALRWPSARVLVGRDGVQLASFGRRTFIGYERVRDVRCDRDDVVITLLDDEVVRLPISAARGRWGIYATAFEKAWLFDPETYRVRRETLAEQIDSALTRFRDAGAAAANASRILERGTRSIAEWRDALSRSGAYREPHLGTEDLLVIVENPQTTVDQRLGAALALADGPDQGLSDPDRQSRIRAAIASSANRRLRIALEKAAAGSLDDAAYEAALEAETTTATRAVRRASPV